MADRTAPVAEAVGQASLQRGGRTPWVLWALVALAALITALGFGLNYGLANGNHHTYVLEGLRRLDPQFLANDWLASETYLYHPVFAWVVVLAGRAGSVAWGLALGDVVLIAVSLLLVYDLLRRIAGPAAFPAWLFVAGVILLDQTNSVAGSYLFSSELQPSGIASLALLYAMSSFVRGNALRTGIGIAFAGMMHINFLLVGIAGFAVAQGVIVAQSLVPRLRRDALQRALRDALAVLGPALVVFAVNLPLLLSFASAQEGELGRRIFMFVRSPHHYVPSEWMYQLGPFIAWQALAVPGYRWLRLEASVRARVIALHVALAGLVGIATLLTTVVFVPTVSQLYFWRLAPFAVLLAQLVLAIGLVHRIVTGAARVPGERWTVQATAERWREVAREPGVLGPGRDRGRLVAWVCGVAGWIVLIRYFAWREGLTGPGALVLLGATVALLAATHRVRVRRAAPDSRAPAWPPWRRTPNPGSLRVTTGVALAVFLALALVRVPDAWARSNVLYPDSPPDELALYAWARGTEPDARFLIPPDLTPFRLRAERAVVVDWKSTPILADELVEWYRRIGRVSGEPHVADIEAATRGYLHMDRVRLDSLIAEFDVDYVVLPAKAPLARAAHGSVFRNASFVVLRARRDDQSADLIAS